MKENVFTVYGCNGGKRSCGPARLVVGLLIRVVNVSGQIELYLM